MIKKMVFIFVCLINVLFVNANSLSEELEDAIDNRDINKVKVLLKKGVDVNDKIRGLAIFEIIIPKTPNG